MKNVEGRLSKLEQGTEPEPGKTVFFWREGDDLTPNQKVEVAEAEARGDKVAVFGWNPREGTPPDLNAMIENANDDELKEIISAGACTPPRQDS